MYFSVKSDLFKLYNNNFLFFPFNYVLLTFKDVVQIEDSWSRQTREQAATEARLQQENAQLKTSLTQKDMAIKGKSNKIIHHRSLVFSGSMKI